MLTVTEAANHKMRGDFTVLDAQQAVLARMTGFETVMDESLNQAFKPEDTVSN